MLRRKLAVLMAAVLMAVMMLAAAGPASAQQGSPCEGFGELRSDTPRFLFIVFLLAPTPQDVGQLIAGTCNPD